MSISRVSPLFPLCLLALSTVVSTPSIAARAFLGVEVERIERVIDLGYNLDPQANIEIARMEAEHPGSPVPGLLRSGQLYWLQNYAEWDEERTERFEESVEDSLDRAKDFLKRNKGSPDAEFVVAMNELLQVIHLVDKRRWWPAFWKSRSSLKVMKRLLEENPDYHDAKMPLGMANCYMSQTPGYLKPLAFLMRFKGDMSLGLQYMREAKRHGLFAKVDAAYHLGAIHIELEKDREKARAEFAALVESYPDNLMFQTTLAELERSLDMHAAARDRAISVLEHRMIEEFSALQAGALQSLLWTSLALGEYDLTIRVSEQFAKLAEERQELEAGAQWALYARAEALNGMGRVEPALELWRSVSAENSRAQEAARKRIEEVRAGLVEQRAD